MIKETDVGWSQSWSRSRFFQAGVGVGAGVTEIWSTPQPWLCALCITYSREQQAVLYIHDIPHVSLVCNWICTRLLSSRLERRLSSLQGELEAAQKVNSEASEHLAEVS